MSGDVPVRILKQKICDSQRAAQVWQLVLPAIELIMQVVWNEALDESLEECVYAGQVKLGFLLVGDLPHSVTEILDRSRRWLEKGLVLRTRFSGRVLVEHDRRVLLIVVCCDQEIFLAVAAARGWRHGHVQRVLFLLLDRLLEGLAERRLRVR